jgi:hypothetical protein
MKKNELKLKDHSLKFDHSYNLVTNVVKEQYELDLIKAIDKNPYCGIG